MSTEIVLVRHGETPLNASRVFQHPDTPLSERGLAQAAAAAERLAGMGIDVIISSDMMRAYQTADALARRLGLPIVTNELLSERNFGDLRGLARSSIDFDADAEDYEPPNGESNPVFYQRVARAFDWVLNHPVPDGARVAVFTHGLVLRRIIAAHLSLPPGVQPCDQFANTAITILGRDRPHHVSLLACDRHLSELAGTASRGVSGL
ncbi:MAG: histidine phosphatase family protein [Burkholderiaceae bacterium]